MLKPTYKIIDFLVGDAPLSHALGPRYHHHDSRSCHGIAEVHDAFIVLAGRIDAEEEQDGAVLSATCWHI